MNAMPGLLLVQLVALRLALLLGPSAALAHEGHDHGPPEPALPAQAAPRATAESEDFELVAVLEGGGLTLYLDRHASNAPVSGARVEVESGALKAAAPERAAGVYALAGEALARPGSHPLTVTVQAGEALDLLAATLVVPAARPAGQPTAAKDASRWLAWRTGGAALLVLLGLAGAGVAWRGRRRRA